MKIFKFICIVALVLCVSSASYAMEKRSAQIISLDGTAEVKQVSQTAWVPASVGTVLNKGDTLKTAAKSWALLNVDNGKIATVEVKEGSS